jgi:6-phosphogluconolactonase/glucosamine-6-phosphate isomerase/deaminase
MKSGMMASIKDGHICSNAPHIHTLAPVALTCAKEHSLSTLG